MGIERDMPALVPERADRDFTKLEGKLPVSAGSPPTLGVVGFWWVLGQRAARLPV